MVNSALTSMNLAGNPVGNQAMIALAAGLAVNQSLVEMKLCRMHNFDQSSDSGVVNEGFEKMAAVLKLHETLATVDLSGNMLSDACCDELAQTVKLGRLKEIILAGCHISPAGCCKLAAALEENTSVTRMNLSGNCVHDSVCKVLALSLIKNKTLRSLDLSSNPMTTEGIEALVDALQINRTLIDLALKNCTMSKDARRAMNEKLESAQTRQVMEQLFSNSVYLAGKEIPADVKTIITNCL
uniref:Uncharacterized protein n=2 Tax=Chrysotila carterae TaxID=13221 RepID=A0A7S4F3P1_CHRCT